MPTASKGTVTGAPAKGTPETCENCGAAIGQLETPLVWQDHVVCGPCYGRLNPPAVPYASERATDAGVQLIEKTSKKWKLLELVGAVVCIAGFLMFLFSEERSPALHILWLLVSVVGLCAFGYARFMAWWHHG